MNSIQFPSQYIIPGRISESSSRLHSALYIYTLYTRVSTLCVYVLYMRISSALLCALCTGDNVNVEFRCGFRDIVVFCRILAFWGCLGKIMIDMTEWMINYTQNSAILRGKNKNLLCEIKVSVKCFTNNDIVFS